MKRIAFPVRSVLPLPSKAVIKICIVRHDNRPLAIRIFHAFADHFENGMQRFIFCYRITLRVGQLIPVKCQSGRIKGLHPQRLHIKFKPADPASASRCYPF